MAKTDRIDTFFAMQSARSDHWRSVLTAAEGWAAGHGSKSATEAALAEIAVLPAFAS
jgi:arginine decarboxylase